MANTLKFGDGKWATGEGTALAFNDENKNFKPLPFTFTRASKATVVNESGLIEEVGNDVPRIDFKDNTKGALLLEPQRTNLLTYSENFENNNWLKSNTTFSSNIVTANSGSSFKYIGQNETTQGVQTAFFDVEYIDHQWLHILVGSSASDTGSINFDIQNKVVGYSEGGFTGNVIDYGSFIRILVNFNTTGKTNIILSFIDSDAATRVPTSNSTGSFKLYRSQLEAGSYPTSYIPTSGSAVTRVADSCSQTVPDGVIGQTEGTVFLDFKPQTVDETSRYLSIENSSSVSNGWMGIFSALSSSNIRFRFYGDGWDFSSTLIVEKDTRYKVAFSYKNGVQTSVYVNGNLIGNLTASLSGKSFQKIRLSEATFGVRGDADFNDLKLYDTALTDQELIALTTI